MEVTAHVISRWQSARKQGRSRILVGLCGRAGAGKTTLARRLAEELSDSRIDSRSYTGDWRLTLDSVSRKAWIGQSWREGVSAYLSAINQFNWWDFAGIQDDLAKIMAGQPISIHGAYDRASGKRDLLVQLPVLESGVVLFENAILGGVESLASLDMIILLNTSDRACFERTLGKDAARRSIPEIAARYLMTTYSENFFLETLSKCGDKILACDSTGSIGAYPEIVRCSHVPMAREMVVSLLSPLLGGKTARTVAPREVEPMTS